MLSEVRLYVTIITMKKVKKLIVGNWKMNPVDVDEARRIASSVKRVMARVTKTNVVLCVPFVYIPVLSKIPSKSLFLGAQNANFETLGSLTGEVSYSQLYQFGVRFVIVGHSERRKMGETNEVVNRKLRSVVGEGMTAIICVGESSRDSNGEFYDFIKQQILSSLKDVPKKLLGQVVIAYEPLWAIGAQDAMNPTELHEMSIYIKKVLRDFYGMAADSIRVIYGGAVDNVNADRLIREGNVSGFLIGRESLKVSNFIEIIKLADTV